MNMNGVKIPSKSTAS